MIKFAEERFDIYKEYLEELFKSNGEDMISDATILQDLNNYESESFYDWKDIFYNGNKVGFVIFATEPECHPSADYYIAEAYVKPEFRNMGLMTELIQKRLKSKPGTYVLLVFKTNDYALKFWKDEFAKADYIPIYLRNLAASPKFIQLAFMKE